MFKRVFTLLDESTEVTFTCKDGDRVRKGEKLGIIRGDIRVLLSGERTALNFLQRMSGIATYTRKIANLLTTEQKAVSGAALSAEFGVSRQIIVQDISPLRSSGYDIISTHNGYLIQKTSLKERVFKVYHTTERTEEELNLIVDLGGIVVDVFV